MNIFASLKALLLPATAGMTPATPSALPSSGDFAQLLITVEDGAAPAASPVIPPAFAVGSPVPAPVDVAALLTRPAIVPPVAQPEQPTGVAPLPDPLVAAGPADADRGPIRTAVARLIGTITPSPRPAASLHDGTTAATPPSEAPAAPAVGPDPAPAASPSPSPLAVRQVADSEAEPAAPAPAAGPDEPAMNGRLPSDPVVIPAAPAGRAPAAVAEYPAIPPIAARTVADTPMDQVPPAPVPVSIIAPRVAIPVARGDAVRAPAAHPFGTVPPLPVADAEPGLAVAGGDTETVAASKTQRDRSALPDPVAKAPVAFAPMTAASAPMPLARRSLDPALVARPSATAMITDPDSGMAVVDEGTDSIEPNRMPDDAPAPDQVASAPIAPMPLAQYSPDPFSIVHPAAVQTSPARAAGEALTLPTAAASPQPMTATLTVNAPAPYRPDIDTPAVPAAVPPRGTDVAPAPDPHPVQVAPSRPSATAAAPRQAAAPATFSSPIDYAASAFGAPQPVVAPPIVTGVPAAVRPIAVAPSVLGDAPAVPTQGTPPMPNDQAAILALVTPPSPVLAPPPVAGPAMVADPVREAAPAPAVIAPTGPAAPVPVLDIPSDPPLPLMPDPMPDPIPDAAPPPAEAVKKPIRSEALSLLQLVRDQITARPAAKGPGIAAPQRAGKPAPAPALVADGAVASAALPVLPSAPPQAASPSLVAPLPVADIGGTLANSVVAMGVQGQWIDGLARDIAMLSANGAQGSFQVSSAALGPIQVDIRQGAEGMNIGLMATSAAAVDALRQDSDRLRSDATLSSVRIADIRIDRVPTPAEAPRDSGHQQSGGQSQNANANGAASQGMHQGRHQPRENFAGQHKGGGEAAVLNHVDAREIAQGGGRTAGRARYA